MCHALSIVISSYVCSSSNVFSVCGLPSYVVFSFYRWACFFQLGNYFTLVFDLTLFTKVLAGLKAGILWAGIMIVVFLEMFLPVFSALFLMIKLPKPRK